jgi:hypothetical protein
VTIYKETSPEPLLRVDATADEINITELNRARSVIHLVSDVHNDEEDQADVRCEKVTRVPVNERREPVGYEDKGAEEETVPSQVRLEGGWVRQGVSIDPLELGRFHKTEVAHVNTRPGDETGDGRDVHEPVKDVGAAGRQVQKGQQAKRRRKEHSHVRGTIAGRLGEELWGVVFVGQRNNNTAARVHVGLGSREHGSEKNGVDDVGENLDTGEVAGNNEGRGRRVAAAVHKLFVVGRDKDADEEEGGHEKGEDTPEGPADSGGHGFGRVYRLTRSHTDQLGTLVTEASRNQDGPKADKLANCAGYHVFVERAWADPIFESKVALLANASINANGKNDKTNNGDDLDTGEVHFELSKPSHRKQVGCRENDPENGNENTNVDAVVPVLNNDTSRRQLQGERHGPTEPVNPAHGETERGVDKTGGVDGEAAGDGDIRGHLSQGDHDGVDDSTDKDEGDQHRDGARLGEGGAASQEQTGAYRASNGEELEVVGFEATLELGRGSLNVPGAIERVVGGLGRELDREVVLLFRLDPHGGLLGTSARRRGKG